MYEKILDDMDCYLWNYTTIIMFNWKGRHTSPDDASSVHRLLMRVEDCRGVGGG